MTQAQSLSAMAGYALNIDEVVLDIQINSNNIFLVINKLLKYGQLCISVLAEFLLSFVWIFWFSLIYQISILE